MTITMQETAIRLKRLELENAELRRQLRVDLLTQLYNGRALREFVESSRYDGYFVFADGDGMGALNKDLGHSVVDAYIVEFGAWLQSQVRYVRDGRTEYGGVERRRNPCTADAWASREHGDEFLVWCSNQRGALRIRNAIRRWHSVDGRVTFSAGMGRDIDTADGNCTAFKRRRKI